jgi:hypothetical protein
MKKEIKIVVPNDYSAISLRKYLQLQRDLEVYKDDTDAVTATLFYHLCDVEPGLMSKLDTETFMKIREQLFSFVAKSDFELKKFVTINGIEYGFEPNLSQMEYGAYVDIAKYKELKINEDWKKIMAILYRPVTKKLSKMYEIEAYTGKEESEHWNDVNMEVHFGALFFFINLSKDLLNSTLNSLTETPLEIPHNIKSILEKSGEVISQL